MAKSTQTENRYAVCIGINTYTTTAHLPVLEYAEADACALDALLARLGFPDENRKCLLGENATLENINAALEEMILDRPYENDLVLFYFAGHGKPLQFNDADANTDSRASGEVFLASYDFDTNKLRQSRSFRTQRALGMKRLRETFFEGEGSRKRLFLFDSCYSGDFFGPRYRDDTDPVQGYIQHMLDSKSTGRLAISSCLPTQKAREDAERGHGLFTDLLLKALAGEDRDAVRQDGCLTVNSLFEYLAEKLPETQRPVLSGVQQDTFKLNCYPQLINSKEEVELTSKGAQHDARHEEKSKRLRAMLADHDGFLRDRLISFVGRQKELAEIRERIKAQMLTGGYVTITGQAGQGKSSIIAKLVEEYREDKVAYHFIPFNPGPDHQVGLLRNIMTRLILKYDLSDIYVASESRPVLRDYFPNLLAELVKKGGQEVIFIDGLDQLEEDFSGVRDLSFLPNNPPLGVVFVLGTRPNDTLKPLELLKPHQEYKLPNLSRQDFDLILQHRKVQLDKVLADQFYQAMQENALYLDLVAKELMEAGTISPVEIINRLVNNPENLFSLSMTRLKRQPLEWREVIKPLLGLFLAAQEPLSVPHIRQILGIEDDRLREGIVRLGGLIVNDGQQRYTLFHLKLRDYLRQNEHNPQKEYVFAKDEEESWHKTLAAWNEGGTLASIWQDIMSNQIEQKRREYARWHYITHLYYAQEWLKLFNVLDSMEYGQEKVRFDPSIRPYAQDLDLGRKAASWEKRDLQEGIGFLPYLWRYTLLRCSLSNRAENYPPEVFEALVLLGRHQQALNLAELLTNPYHKARTLLQIVEYLKKQLGREQECQQLLKRAFEVATSIENAKEKAEILYELSRKLSWMQQWEQAQVVIYAIEMSWEKNKALGGLGIDLVKAQQWEQAEAVISTIEVNWVKDSALRELGVELVKAQQWKRAKVVMQMIEGSSERARVLQDLGTNFAKAQQWKNADKKWQQAMTVVCEIQESDARVRAIHELILRLIDERQWRQTEEMILLVEGARARAKVLQEFGVALAKAQQWEQAEAVISTIEVNWVKDSALRELGVELVKAQQWKRAKVVMQMIEGSSERARVLQEFGVALAKLQQWEQAEAVVHIVGEVKIKIKVLYNLGIELNKAKKWKHAEEVWEQAIAMVHIIQRKETRTEVLRELCIALITVQQWERAEIVTRMIKEDEIRTEMLQELGIALTTAKRQKHADSMWIEAEAVADRIENSGIKARALIQLGRALAKVHQQKHAAAIWAKVPSLIYTIEGSDLVTEALHRQVLELSKVQQWKLAEVVALAIDNDEAQAQSLKYLSTTLAKLMQWDHAEVVALLIKGVKTKIEALQSLDDELVKTGQWKKAQAVKRMIKKSMNTTDVLLEASGLPLLRVESMQRRIGEPIEFMTPIELMGKNLEDVNKVQELQELGIAFAKKQQWEKAEAMWVEVERVAQGIWSSGARAQTLRGLSLALAKLQQWERAKVVIRTIGESKIQKKALRELSIELVRAQQWEQAVSIADSIGNNEDKAAVLIEMVRALESAGEYIKILHLIQHSWQQADSKVYSINLLSMVTSLFPLNPKIIPSFYESFDWVDTFLSR